MNYVYDIPLMVLYIHIFYKNNALAMGDLFVLLGIYYWDKLRH